MDNTITLLLQLSLITPFVMLLVAALVGFRILKGHPHWPALFGIGLTTLVALASAILFRTTIQSQTYSKTLIQWLALGSDETQRLSIGVLFDPLSLGWLLLIAMASLVYLLLDPPLPIETSANSRFRFAAILYLLCFAATAGIVLATNFLQLLLFWLMLSLSLNLLHELTLADEPGADAPTRHWWGWNAFSDAMLLLAVLLINQNFKSVDFLTCLQPAAIQEAYIQNRVALPGIGAALFLAALPRLNLFPASALIVGRETSWPARSLAALTLLSLPAGLFLLFRTAPYFLAIEANQRLLLQLGTLSAFLTLFSALCLTRGQKPDRCFYWLAATMAGLLVAVLGLTEAGSLLLLIPTFVLQSLFFAMLIPLSRRLQQASIPTRALTAIKVCLLLSMLAAFSGLGTFLHLLVSARVTAANGRIEFISWLLLAVTAGYVFGLARSYFFLSPRAEVAAFSTSFSTLPLWGMTIVICLLSITVYLPIPYTPQFGPALLSENQISPFEQDWLYASLFCVLPLLALILAWMLTPQMGERTSRRSEEPSLMQLGQSHYYSLSLLNRTLLQPLAMLAKLVTLADTWLLTRCSRFSLETLPSAWGVLLKQMQNGQLAFQALVLLFTLSILIFVLLVLQI